MTHFCLPVFVDGTAVTQFKQVTFRHIPRTANCLADALATEAINGRTVSMPPATTKTSWKWFKK